MGLKTLGVRMEKHEKNAMKTAKWLEQNPKVERCTIRALLLIRSTNWQRSRRVDLAR